MNEFISKEKVLNLIEHNDKVFHYADKQYEDIVYATTQKICVAVADMQAADVQPVNQWISVDDKLPELDKTVLVWYASDTLFGVSEGYGLSWYHGSWRLNELNGENIRIFYWQYLPEKPKEG